VYEAAAIAYLKKQEAPSDGERNGMDYLRHANIKFDKNSVISTYQEEGKISLWATWFKVRSGTTSVGQHLSLTWEVHPSFVCPHESIRHLVIVWGYSVHK